MKEKLRKKKCNEEVKIESRVRKQIENRVEIEIENELRKHREKIEG